MKGHMSLHPFLVTNLALLLLTIVAGGASRENAIPLAVVELASLALLPWSIARLVENRRWTEMNFPLAIIVLMALTPVSQLIPLPPGLWTHMPGGPSVREIYDGAGLELPWRPLSLAPAYTVRSALSLLAPISIFLGWSGLSSTERGYGIVAILVALIAGLLLGSVQLAAGGQSVGYLYSNTNYGALVGFFANRHHEAAMLLCSLPLSAALLVNSDKTRGAQAALIITSLALTFVVVGALGAVQSRAGILLLPLVLAGSLAVVLRSGRLGTTTKVSLSLAGLLTLAISLILVFGLGPLMQRFDNNVAHDLRFMAAPTILRVGVEHLPFGSGLGTFDLVYRSVEKISLVGPAFFNHAHDDYLELFMETGVVGIGIAGLFLIWVVIAAWKVWPARRSRSVSLGQAGFVVIAVVLVHSSLDYPLRTTSIMAVFAFACALLNGGMRNAERA
jgi:hypothetical protein